MNHTDYYVYAHRDLNGVVFYIGKGRGYRAYSKDQRSGAWKIAAKDGYNVEILKFGIDENTALSEEMKLLSEPRNDWNLVNILKTNKRKSYPLDIFREFLVYDETSPTFIRWKVDRYGGENSAAKIAKAGDVAGTICKGKQAGYTYVIIDYERYCVHRIIYMLFHGHIPKGYVVNHIDNNPANNSITNLEICTQAQNIRRTKSHNGSLMSTNNSGFTGVSKMVDDRYWSARWYENDKQKVKHFSIEKHGETEAFRLACEYRKQMIEKLNSEGAGYSIAE